MTDSLESDEFVPKDCPSGQNFEPDDLELQLDKDRQCSVFLMGPSEESFYSPRRFVSLCAGVSALVQYSEAYWVTPTPRDFRGTGLTKNQSSYQLMDNLLRLRICVRGARDSPRYSGSGGADSQYTQLCQHSSPLPRLNKAGHTLAPLLAVYA